MILENPRIKFMKDIAMHGKDLANFAIYISKKEVPVLEDFYESMFKNRYDSV